MNAVLALVLSRHGLLALLSLAWACQVSAQSSCTLSAYLSQDPLTVDEQSLALGARMTARTAIPLRVASTDALLSEMGLQGEANAVKLAREVRVADLVLGLGQIVRDSAQLAYTGAKGPILLRSANRTFAYSGAQAGGDERSSVDVVPDLLMPAAIVLSAGSVVTREGESIVVASGSEIAWDLTNPASVPFRLVRTTRLREANVMRSAARITDVSPERSLPGGAVQVTLAAGNVDFEAHPPLFCLSVGGTDSGSPGGVNGVRGDLVRRTDQEAVFSVQLPDDREEPSDLAGRASGIGSVADFFMGTPAVLRVVVGDGSALVVDSSRALTMTSRAGAALLALALTVVTVWILARSMVKEGPMSLVRDLSSEGGRYSLANVQTFMWSIVVLFSMIYVWLATGKVIPISSGVLVLLGISGGTLVLARSVEALDPAPQLQPQSQSQPRSKSDLITKDGVLDIPRFQMLAFTVFACLYALVNVLRSEGLPDIPESLYLLMGISSATYVGSKVPAVLGGTTPATAGATSPGELSLDAAAIRKVQEALKVPASGTLDEATRQAIIQYKLDNNMIPASGELGPLLAKRFL